MLALTALLALFPAQERAESWCPRNFIPGPPEMSTWVLDNDLAEQLTTATVRLYPDSMNFPGDVPDSPAALTDRNVTNDDLLAMVDRVVQGFARRARIRVQARVVLGECAPGSDRCIAGVTDGYDGGDHCEDSDETGASAAYGGCYPGSCSVWVCEERRTRWLDGLLEKVLTHEFGHVFGLSHVDEQGGSRAVCQTDADCPADSECEPSGIFGLNLCSPTCQNQDTHNGDWPQGCGFDTGDSDGCGGEVMCARAKCAAGWYLTSGDQVGLRTRYPSSPEERRVFLGVEQLPVEDFPTFTETGRSSFFPPRIDCAKSASPVNQCAMVTTAIQSDGEYAITVLRMSGFGAGNTFNELEHVNTFELAPSEALAHPPDIAVDANGTIAWVTYTVPGRAGEVHVLRFDLESGTMADIDLNFGAVLPPRIAFNTDIGEPIVIAVRNKPGASERFDKPAWIFTRIFADNTIAKTEDFWNDGSAATLASSEFDVDCESHPGGADDCVVVAQRYETTEAADGMWSRSFTVNASSVVPAASWSFANYRNNGIIGVAVVRDPQRLLVSAGRAITNGTSTDNTRLLERSRFDFNSSGAVADDVNRSDAVSTCRTGSHAGLTFAAATMHGGYSWSYCPSCTTGSPPLGRLLSLHFGLRTDGDDFCF